MEVKILQMLDGAKKSEGVTVIIDVFRAFTVECFLYYCGAKKIYPIKDFKDCLLMKEKNPDYFLVGERNGIKIDGFDCGNSPSQLYLMHQVEGKTICHSTSSGTQGIIEAINNMSKNTNPVIDVITGSIVNAKAIAQYIKFKNPNVVSLVPMGLGGILPAEEDTLCAEYIKYLLEGDNFNEKEDKFNIQGKMWNLKNTTGAKFFDLQQKAAFPMPDFFMCLMPNIFNFVLEIEKEEETGLYCSKRVNVG